MPKQITSMFCGLGTSDIGKCAISLLSLTSRVIPVPFTNRCLLKKDEGEPAATVVPAIPS